MTAYLIDFTSMLLRWLHVIAAIAWIGESFFFVMQDNSLREPEDPADRRPEVAGELWLVHGGGFYHNLKYTTRPGKLPEHLHWSYLKAYTTWLSGFALFAVIYLTRPDLQLINHASDWAWAANMAGWQANIVAVLFLVLGWVVYNELCKRISPNMTRDGVLSFAVAAMMIGVAWVSMHIFPGRAAFLLTGAVMATCMAANVLAWIIPGQRRMVAALKAGETPNPLDGKRGKQRSVHNTYFTLPVVFLMLANHYPALFTNAHAWQLMVLFLFAGALIRQFFVLMHAGHIKLAYPAIGIVLIVAAFWLSMPTTRPPAPAAATDAGTAASTQVAPPTFAQIRSIIDHRCVSCHAAHPTEPGFTAPPKNIDLENAQTILAWQTRIKQVVASRYMPLGNLTHISKEERAQIAAWSDQGAETKPTTPQ